MAQKMGWAVGLMLNKSQAATPLVNRGGIWGVAILLILYLGLAICYAIITPVFEKPDEYLHFAFAMYLHETGKLPVQHLDQRDHQAGQQGSQPPLIYASVVAVWKLAGIERPSAGFSDLTVLNPHYNWQQTPWLDNENQFLRGECTGDCAITQRAAMIGRGVGIFYGLLALIGAALAVHLAFPQDRGLMLLVVGVMGFNPQFLHIASSVSNDIPTVAMINLAFAAGLWWWREPASIPRVILLAIPVGLTALSKVSGLSIGLVMVLLLLFGGNLSWQLRLRQIAIFGGVVLLICGWWYWRNYDLYGDLTATRIHLEIYTDMSPPEHTFDRLSRDWITVFHSFWASFGWKEINPGVIPQGLVAGLVAFLVGRTGWIAIRRDPTSDPLPTHGEGIQGRGLSLVNYIMPLRRPTSIQQVLLLLCLLQLFITAITLTQWMRQVDAPLGRLLFPALLPISLILMLGVPRSWRGIGLGAWAVAPIMMAVTLIYPAYHPPQPLFEPEPGAVLAVAGDNNLLLRDIAWGEDDQWVYLQATWEVAIPLDQNYQVFVHAREHPYWILSQRDTYPGLGHRLTSEMEPGQLFTEVYPLAKAPGQPVTSFALGFYVPTAEGWTRLSIHSETFEVIEDALQLPLENVRRGHKIR